MACVVYAAAVLLHEGAHAVAGYLVGGEPTLISTTDLRGNWDGVGTFGFSLIGISGSAVNWLLAGCASVFLRRKSGNPTLGWFWWLVFAVNGFIPALYMILSPAAGFGDWNTILSRWPAPLVWRVVITALGVLVTLLWVRATSRFLGQLMGNADVHSILRLVRNSWLAGGLMAVAAALLSPLGLLWAVPLALGSTLGTTWPMMPVARLAQRHASGDVFPGIPASRGWVAAGILSAAVFIGMFGPGLALG